MVRLCLTAESHSGGSCSADAEHSLGVSVLLTQNTVYVCCGASHRSRMVRLTKRPFGSFCEPHHPLACSAVHCGPKAHNALHCTLPLERWKGPSAPSIAQAPRNGAKNKGPSAPYSSHHSLGRVCPVKETKKSPPGSVLVYFDRDAGPKGQLSSTGFARWKKVALSAQHSLFSFILGAERGKWCCISKEKGPSALVSLLMLHHFPLSGCSARHATGHCTTNAATKGAPSGPRFVAASLCIAQQDAPSGLMLPHNNNEMLQQIAPSALVCCCIRCSCGSVCGAYEGGLRPPLILRIIHPAAAKLQQKPKRIVLQRCLGNCSRHFPSNYFVLEEGRGFAPYPLSKRNDCLRSELLNHETTVQAILHHKLFRMV